MICRALDAGVPTAWVTGDEADGANPALRAELEAREVGYVLAVVRDHRVRFGGTGHRVDALLRLVPPRRAIPRDTDIEDPAGVVATRCRTRRGPGRTACPAP
jgi:hypothetical protein